MIKQTNSGLITTAFFALILLAADVIAYRIGFNESYQKGYSEGQDKVISRVDSVLNNYQYSLSADSVESFINHSKIPTRKIIKTL